MKSIIRFPIATFLMALALFVFASLLTFNSNDPPFGDYPQNVPLKNYCGWVGSVLSGYAIIAFDKTSYIFPFLISLLGIYLFTRGQKSTLWIKIIGGVLLVFSTAPIFAVVGHSFKLSEQFSQTGGIVGAVIAPKLISYFGVLGTYIIISLGFCGALALILNMGIITPFVWIFNKLKYRHLKPKTPHMLSHPVEVGQEPKVKTIESRVRSQASRIESWESETMTQDSSDHMQLPIELLDPPEPKHKSESDTITLEKAEVLKNTLLQFEVSAEFVGFEKGPSVTMYELELAPGTKVGKIIGLSDDLAIALKAPSVRVVAPIPGKSSIGIEVPNTYRRKVVLRELFEFFQSGENEFNKQAIPLLLGKDIAGYPVISDLSVMPHLLIAGTTGSGKSVCLNSVILSILFKKSKNDVKLLLVDPKMVELSAFSNIPHLINPVVTDMKEAAAVLEWAVNKMDERYSLLARAGVRNLTAYNKLGQREIRKRLNPEGDAELDVESFHLPHIVIIADELADLMMVASKRVETAIIRLSQKSRAVGIHLVLATQRPSVDVITGLIKSNLPARISFQVASKVDSRTILDQNGAEKLLGSGDMLFLPPGTSKLIRVQGTYVSDAEVRRVVEFLREREMPEFSTELKQLKTLSQPTRGEERDDLYNDAVRIVLSTKRGSVSLLQRKLEIGYARAARLIDIMAEDGLVGDFKDGQAREVLMTLEEWDERAAQNIADNRQ
ncbi:MAG TPA: DNA translocase FtsK [Candidatus Brocadiia bacterium]|nr:DNA translocase FtsK 4TM domain-containing protein [Planctomycetota bacterium]MDO8092714.1 DNA translocase FtsK 4TM domain-containing protein [Candidatus Brocadiales bacterium]